MIDIFPDSPSYEFPSIINVLFALSWAFLLSSVVAITHKLTFRGENYPVNFFQAMILGGIVTAIVMMAIGDSLARGLGVFGAMAIIRFRTRIEDPRNVLFLFAALSTGIAIGVYGYTIAFTGTIVFSVVAGILNMTQFKVSRQSNLLSFTLTDSTLLTPVNKIIAKYCEDSNHVNITITKSNEVKHDFYVVLIDKDQKDNMLQEMSKIEGVTQLKITKTNIFSY